MADRVFVFAGQSNMLGVATSGDLPANLQTPDANIKTWTDGAEFVTLEHAVNGNDLNGGTTTTWGPEAEFLRLARVDYPSDTFYMVKYAGSGLQLYNSGATNWHPDKVGSLFDAVVGHVSDAKAALANPVIESVIWFQGESDANDATRGDAYESNLTAWLAAAINEWGGDSVTRFLIAQIWMTDTVTYLKRDVVRAAEEAVVAANPIIARLVDTQSFARGDGLHLNATGNVSCGAALWATSKQVRRARLRWS